MSNTGESRPVEDFGGLIKLYSDGSVVRGEEPSLSSAIPEHDNYNHVPFKDVVFEEDVGLWARLYLPPQTKTRVPVLLYFHGGGFCVLTPASPLIHRTCQLWTATLGVIIVSVNYRLAPEHRLPAAYDDSIAALKWLQSMKAEGEGAGDPWLHSHADFSKVFVAGESAGGNIAHHVGTWVAAAAAAKEQDLFGIKGMILVYPYFGGEERTPSEGEEEGALSPVPRMFTVAQSDVLWRLALPLGSNRDHPFCNPVADGAVVAVSSLALLPMLFVIGGRDILRDKQLQYCEVLKKCGKQIEVLMFDEEDHGFVSLKMEDPSSMEALRGISHFIK